MIPHLLLIYQFLVVGVGSAALATMIQRARRSGREDHRAFSLFWGVFTGWMAVKLVKNYVFLNVDGLTPGTGLFLLALDTHFSYLMIAALLRYLHTLAEVKGRKARDIVVLIGVLLSVVLAAPPWGVRFDPGSWVIELRFGLRLGNGFYLIGLAYAVVLSWMYVVRRPRGEDRSFLIALAVFAFAGFVESIINFLPSVVDPVVVMGPQEVTYSTLPYLVYGLFLIVHRGLTGAATPREPAGPAVPLDEAATQWKLSGREKEVAALVLEGYGNKEIAGKLFISTATVKTHVYRIYRKAEVDNRFGLIRALREGESREEGTGVPVK